MLWHQSLLCISQKYLSMLSSPEGQRVFLERFMLIVFALSLCPGIDWTIAIFHRFFCVFKTKNEILDSIFIYPQELPVWKECGA